MVNVPLFSQTRDMLRKCHCFQSRGTWQQYHSNGRWINSEGYMVHIKIGLDFPETVQMLPLTVVSHCLVAEKH